MNQHDERKFLTSLLKQLDTPNRSFLSTFLPTVVVWVLTVLFFMLLFQLCQGYRVNPITLALGSVVTGFIVTCISFSKASLKQWLMLRDHINRQSVKSRLDELDTL